MIVLAVAAFAILRGIYVVVTKLTQKNYVNSFEDSIYLTMMFSFMQAVFLPLMPPYTHYSFETGMLFNPIMFAVFFSASFILYITALRYGSNSMTNTVSGFSLLVPILAGLVLWNEVITLYQIVGLLFFSVIIFLFNRSTFKTGTETKPVTLRWMIIAISSAAANGTCVIFTKQHMIHYSGAIKEYLLMLNAAIFILSLPYLLWAYRRKKFKPTLNRRFIIYVGITALIQNINNIIYMVYINGFKSTSFFPMVGIINIISAVAVSRLILKERVSKLAYAGIVLSFVSIYILNIK